uniref:Intraflagellar transport protein 56 n=1 Tax=Panagrellus redivivus TaxID=6233 RepID=A0A7E4V0V4_PANRE
MSLQLFSRLRPSRTKAHPRLKVDKIKELDEFLEARDYTGALATLEHKQKNEPTLQNSMWLAYCAYHGGMYQQAANVYESILKQKDAPPEVNLYLCCCYLMLGLADEAMKIAEKQPKSELQNQILLHCVYKNQDSKKTGYYHSLLTDSVEDKICYASINFQRGFYTEAADVYRQLLNQNPELLALHIYLALCYYKSDYFDEALECTQNYLAVYPDSPTAINLEASCVYRTDSPKTAQMVLRKAKHIAESELNFAKELILHNTVVFSGGDAALQTLPSLVSVIPEATRNLVIYYLKRGDGDSAFEAANGMEVKNSTDNLLKALVFVLLGYERKQPANIDHAAQYFKLVAESHEEENTIVGRLSMASYLCITKQYKQSLVYYDSIINFNRDDDRFNFNYGQAQLQCENYVIAADVLQRVKDNRFTVLPVYQMSLCRAYIRSKQSSKAWAFVSAQPSTSHSAMVLKLMANDCYLMEDYYYAALAFDSLCRRDPRNELHSAGKRGACMGVLQLFVSHKADREQLMSVLRMLEQDREPESINLAAKARKWATEATLIA